MSLRHSLLPLIALLALCIAGDEARAQATSGSIGIGAIILAPAPGALAGPLQLQLGQDGTELAIRGEPANPGAPTMLFLRAQRPGGSPAVRTFIGQSMVAGRAVHVRVPDAARSVGVRLERLILAGT
ncbi:MAG TPA: hypothetical protein VFY85_01070 [Gemmatimonadaceae bacterium]|nr:hypothetical protein [Gemmatimonadaceae bacterium]